jgi:hypothetical protein
MLPLVDLFLKPEMLAHRFKIADDLHPAPPPRRPRNMIANAAISQRGIVLAAKPLAQNHGLHKQDGNSREKQEKPTR